MKNILAIAALTLFSGTSAFADFYCRPIDKTHYPQAEIQVIVRAPGMFTLNVTERTESMTLEQSFTAEGNMSMKSMYIEAGSYLGRGGSFLSNGNYLNGERREDPVLGFSGPLTGFYHSGKDFFEVVCE
jgi:hypothetical protein